MNVHQIFYVLVLTIALYCISWIIIKISRGDKLLVFKWNKIIYSFFISISIVAWGYESWTTGDWLEPTTAMFMLVMNIVMCLVLFLVYFAYTRKVNRSKVIGSNFYQSNRGQTSNREKYFNQRLSMLFVLTVVVYPILNIGLLYYIFQELFY